MKSQEIIFEETADEKGLGVLAQRVANLLRPRQSFCLWLIGEMGAGKTSFVTQLLYEMGLPKTQPVNSPTYMLSVDYRIGWGVITHFDLHRIDDGACFEWEAFERDEVSNGMIVEWPQAVLDQPEFAPDFELYIQYRGLEERHYKLVAKAKHHPSSAD